MQVAGQINSGGWTMNAKEASGGFSSGTNHWIGTDNLKRLTELTPQIMRIELKDSAGTTKYVDYSSVRVRLTTDNCYIHVEVSLIVHLNDTIHSSSCCVIV